MDNDYMILKYPADIEKDEKYIFDREKMELATEGLHKDFHSREIYHHLAAIYEVC